MRETEKTFKELEKYLDSVEGGIGSEEELNKLVRNFFAEYNSKPHPKVTEKTAVTSDDFLELAVDSDNDAKALKYARKALALDPDNLDAESFIADLAVTDEIKHLAALKRIAEHGRKVMEKQGYMTEDNIGDFWGITATRPYIRCLIDYADCLSDAGMISEAIKVNLEILRLNKDDNNGVRFTLMHLYALLEEEESALKLFDAYPGESTMMLLPMSVLYFKLGDFESSWKYLNRLQKCNKDTKKFFRAIVTKNMDQYAGRMSEYGYRPFTIEELITDVMENMRLFESCPLYMQWADSRLRGKIK